jgi:tetratricopeptide (TPR) repeat protein
LEKHRAFANDAERQGAEKIVRRLRGFPLAVELVGAWLAAHPSATYTGVADGLGLDDLDQFAEDNDVTLRRHNDERRLQAVLAPTLDGLSPAERLTVEYAACLAPDHVALPWLRELVIAQFPELGQSGRLGDPWEELCSRLQRLGIFTRSEGEGQRPRIVRIHRLVHDVVRRMISQTELSNREKAIETLIGQRNTALQQTTRWEQARWEVEPLDALATVWADNDSTRSAWVLHLVGWFWSVLAEWARAEPLMRRALAIDEASFGQQHPKVAIRLNNLAQLLQDTNRLDEAEPLIRRALAIDEASLEAQHPNVAIRLNNLAQLLQETNRLDEAEPLMRRVLAIDESSYGPQHPKVAIPLSNLARLLRVTNRLDEAEPLMRRALAIDEASFGPRHPNVARDLNNLARLLQDTNRLDQTEPLSRRQLEIILEFARITGHKHPRQDAAFVNYAGILKAMGRDNQQVQAELAALANKYGVSYP